MAGMSCEMSTLVVLSSLTGNTRTFLPFLSRQLRNDAVVDYEAIESPSSYTHLVFGSYTWGNGKIPKKMKDYLIANHHHLKDKKVFIFGSGNSVYPKFCGAVDGMAKICSDSGAKVFGKFKFEQSFQEDELTVKELQELLKEIEEWSA